MSLHATIHTAPAVPAPPRPPEREYSTNEVARAAGVTVRQLQWWDEQGVISPRQQHKRRYYSPDKLYEARLAGRMRNAGISLARVRLALDALREQERPFDELERWDALLAVGREFAHVHLGARELAHAAAVSGEPVHVVRLRLGAAA